MACRKQQHDASGDEVSRAAEVLRGCTRNADAVARWSGEEFAELLRDMSMADAASIAERVRSACAQTQLVSREPGWRVTVSIGLAARHAGELGTSWMARADAALYAAKREGRNRVVS